MDQRLVAFDLETVPDIDAGRKALSLDDSVTDTDVRRLMGEFYAKGGQTPEEAFVKVPLQKIVCLGAIYADRLDRGPWNVVRSGVAHIGVRTERQIVSGFIESLGAAPSPQLIGFNSSSFDLPVLRYRAFALEVPAQIIHRGNGKDYWYRFGKDHIDICDVMSGFGASTKPSLVELAALLGVRAKANGVDGSAVEAMIDGGRVEEVAAYCETDVAMTYLIFLRYSLVIGDLDNDSYGLSLNKLRDFFHERVDKRPHLAALLRNI